MQIEPLGIGTTAAKNLSPDILWDGVCGDLSVTPRTDADNPAGLRAQQALATAVLIALQTDRRVETFELPADTANRGWPGDSFDMTDETPLGSKLWLLRRRTLTNDVVLLAEDYAREALQPLIDQGAFVSVDVTAKANFAANHLALEIKLFGRDGAQVFHERYAVLWDQLNGIHAPLT